MKNLNVTLKCHGGQVTWWDGAGQGGDKQGIVYKPTRVCPTDSVLLVPNKDGYNNFFEVSNGITVLQPANFKGAFKISV